MKAGVLDHEFLGKQKRHQVNNGSDRYIRVWEEQKRFTCCALTSAKTQKTKQY